MIDDMPLPGSLCPRCEITVYPGTNHSDLHGCFSALKQFVRLCQDDIEESRMGSFQHPTRDELLQQLEYLEDQFSKFVIYTTSMRDHIAKARMVHY